MFKELAKTALHQSTFSTAAAILVAGCFAARADNIHPADVVISEDLSVDTPLTNEVGDAFRGLEIFVDRDLGNCVACHVNFDVQAMQFLGNLGPELNWIGDTYTEGELRAIMVDSKAVFGEHTVMPSFYAIKHGARTAEEFAGKPILTAQQIEDVVAYLASLSNSDTFEGAD